MSPKNSVTRARANIGWTLLVLMLTACEAPPAQESVWVRIAPGDSLAAIAESLTVNGIVRSPRSFEQLARIGRKHLEIKPGVYPLRPGTPIGKLLVELIRGRPDAVRTRVKAGVWLSELLPELSRSLKIPVESLWAAARDTALRARVGTRAETLEGYLYPTVYYIPINSTALGVVRQMVDTFEAHWAPAWDSRMDSLGLTSAETVVLASIIEGEAPQDVDRPLVSSVYHNRLSRGLRLQADPTVVYAMKKRTRLFNKDYGLESEYNTYQIGGLPHGPICQPSTASMIAALHPPATDYYYFVAAEGGRHIFSKTYSQHLATIRRTRSGRSNMSFEP